MRRQTGIYQTTVIGGEEVRAFVPLPLPPQAPPLALDEVLQQLHREALEALAQLNLAGALVPNPNWFIYGFVRKEAVISSQIEGTQATLQDLVTFELTRQAEQPAEVEEVCNFVAAQNLLRQELAKPDGLPLCTRLLCQAHERLMQGVRGAHKQPGEIRRSQNWIGGSRPGNASFVPPPAEEVSAALGALENWLRAPDPLPPLIRAGLAHVQFETMHPFLDGNGRLGRLLIGVLLEQWGLLATPLLYLSLAFKRHRQDYYGHLMAVRTQGDWEGWLAFFLRCVRESATDGVQAARRLHQVIGNGRQALMQHPQATMTAMRLYERLPDHPMLTLALAATLLQTSAPTAGKALEVLGAVGILREITGRQRDRVYAFHTYLAVLFEDTQLGP